MSTILKALKKLEQETQSAGTPATFQNLGDKPATAPGSTRSRILAGMGIGASLVGLGLVLFFLLRPAAPPPTAPPQGQPVPATPPKAVTAPEDRLPMPKVFPPRQPGDPEPERSIQSKPAATAAGTAVTAAGTTSATAPAATPAPTPKRPAPPAPTQQRPSQEGTSEPSVVAEAASETRPTKTTDAPKTRPQKMPVSQVAPSVTAATPSATQAPAASKPQPAARVAEPVTEAPADPYANVPKLEENSPIKLQAISWAQTADKRIAVINNRVLHEGDSVEGYSVVKIRPDDVIVRREGRMWRANFSIR